MTEEDTIKELRNWDLWGPLLLCMILSIVLSATAPAGQASLVFAAVFVVVWAGAAVVTINAQLLGGKVSFFQSVCVLGYCVFPIVLASFLCLLWSNHIYRSIVTSVAFVWATRASVVFMSQLVNPDRKMLAAFPTLLFYSVLCWMVFIL
jgi:protein YIPF6